jgi:hypothetical protein
VCAADELAAAAHWMSRKYRGVETDRPFNPATIKAMIEGPMPAKDDGRGDKTS